MPSQTKDGLGWRVALLAESDAQAWESFARIASAETGVVTALSDLSLGRGAVPCPVQFSASILPGLDCSTAGVCPLFARALDIFGLRFRRSRLLCAALVIVTCCS